jgi:hypothetical protein
MRGFKATGGNGCDLCRLVMILLKPTSITGADRMIRQCVPLAQSQLSVGLF